jgi:hypothetical protein
VRVQLTPQIQLNIPVLSAAMDTVTATCRPRPRLPKWKRSSVLNRP